jgi:hypothetical protein
MTKIQFEATPFDIKSWAVILLPKAASAKLSSRNMGMARCTINGKSFETQLEPDGRGSHWLRVDQAGIEAGDSVHVALEPLEEWPRPEMPKDLKTALSKHPKAATLWPQVTPKAQWEWIRWIRSTMQAETRQRRVEVACSKLNAGTRRPCCFNSAACTEPYVSRNWQLLEPVPAT